MTIRRKVSHPNLLGYLKFEIKYFNLKNNFYFNTQIFNNFSFYLVLAITCGFLGFLKPLFWAIGLSNCLLIFYLYRKTLSLCHGITVIRKVPAFSREKRVIELHYTISNATAFRLSGLEFIDEFDGVETGQVKIKLDKTLRPHTQIHFIKKVTLDSGMGLKVFRPINLKIADELGIFDFSIQFFQESQIEVYPFIEETPALKTSVSPDSIEFGFFEMPKRGDSNLFIGVRDYRHGDPVKHINWKLSKKTQTVVVNEYEKNTNTFVTLLLELDLGNQLGVGEHSTWETAKDLALSIANNEIHKNNLIQVVSNNLHIPFGSGKSQLAVMEKHFTFHEMINSTESRHLHHLHGLPSRGQIFYVCPLITTPKISETLQFLKKLKSMGQDVVIFVLDPYQEMARKIKGDMKLGIMEMERHARMEFEKFSKEFGMMGVSVVMIKVGRDDELTVQLTQEAQGLLVSK